MYLVNIYICLTVKKALTLIWLGARLRRDWHQSLTYRVLPRPRLLQTYTTLGRGYYIVLFTALGRVLTHEVRGGVARVDLKDVWILGIFWCLRNLGQLHFVDVA